MKNASCKNSVKIDFERNRITTSGQFFRAALLLMIVFLLFPVQSLAASKVFEREYTYSASEADSKLTCRVIALEQVKRLLLEELGTYLHSISEVKDGILTKDEIVTLTAGVVRTEIISEHWDGKIYRLKARIKADPDYVIKAIDRLRKDRQKSKDLEESQLCPQDLIYSYQGKDLPNLYLPKACYSSYPRCYHQVDGVLFEQVRSLIRTAGFRPEIGGQVKTKCLAVKIGRLQGVAGNDLNMMNSF